MFKEYSQYETTDSNVHGLNFRKAAESTQGTRGIRLRNSYNYDITHTPSESMLPFHCLTPDEDGLFKDETIYKLIRRPRNKCAWYMEKINENKLQMICDYLYKISESRSNALWKALGPFYQIINESLYKF